jgi:hypothetical protein
LQSTLRPTASAPDAPLHGPAEAKGESKRDGIQWVYPRAVPAESQAPAEERKGPAKREGIQLVYAPAETAPAGPAPAAEAIASVDPSSAPGQPGFPGKH